MKGFNHATKTKFSAQFFCGENDQRWTMCKEVIVWRGRQHGCCYNQHDENIFENSKVSNVEKFIDSYKETGDMIFTSFDIYGNSPPVNGHLQKDIATFSRKSVGKSKPIYLVGLGFLELLKNRMDAWNSAQFQSPKFSSLSGRFSLM